MISDLIVSKIKKVSDIKRAKGSAWFFKDYEYLGQKNKSDKFLGVRVPQTRDVVKEVWKGWKVGDGKKVGKSSQSELLAEIQKLLDNEYHEVRIAGVMLLKMYYLETLKVADEQLLKKLFNFYNKNVGWNKGVNNWDSVDESAREIVGEYISNHMTHDERLAFIDKSIASKDLWVNRVVVVATWYQIRKGNEKMCFYVVERLLSHPYDLIHKACGWMLREVGKCCGREVLEKFIYEHIQKMPRTCLRYAIEHFPQTERKKILQM